MSKLESMTPQERYKKFKTKQLCQMAYILRRVIAQRQNANLTEGQKIKASLSNPVKFGQEIFKTINIIDPLQDPLIDFDNNPHLYVGAYLTCPLEIALQEENNLQREIQRRKENYRCYLDQGNLDKKIKAGIERLRK